VHLHGVLSGLLRLGQTLLYGHFLIVCHLIHLDTRRYTLPAVIADVPHPSLYY
jgi:hypothetical protein